MNHRIPDFFVIGAAKCASTSLCVGLGRHPGIFMPQQKELNHFSDPSVRKLGLNHYSSYFSSASAEQIVGEGSVSYTYRRRFPDTAKRIAEHALDAKIIYIVRNPIDRMASMYLQMQASGNLASSVFIDEAMRSDDVLVDSTLYWRQLSEYRKYWSDESILILFFDDWVEDQDAVLAECHSFLGLERKRPPAPVKAFSKVRGQRIDGRVAALLRRMPFSAKFRDTLPEPIRRYLRESLRPEIGDPPELGESTRRRILDAVREDSGQLLSFCGRQGLWNLA